MNFKIGDLVYYSSQAYWHNIRFEITNLHMNGDATIKIIELPGNNQLGYRIGEYFRVGNYFALASRTSKIPQYLKKNNEQFNHR